MDFHGMKRKELQALCKKHNIPSNLSNNEMANRLTELLKDGNEPVAECQDEKASEIETLDVVVNKKVKKVRFSPEHELIEFSRTINLKRRSKRNSACISSSSVSKETVSSSEINNEIVGRQGRVTRSRGQKPMEDKENENKRGRNGVKRDNMGDEVSVENLDNSELVESDVNCSRSVTRLRGKVVVKGGKDEVKRERRRAKKDDESDQKALDNGDDKLTEKVVDNPRRVKRSRGQKVMVDATKKEEKGGNVVENNENAYLSSTENDKEGKEEVKRERKRAKNDDESDRKALDNGDDDKLTEKVVDNPRRVTRSRGLKAMEDATKKEKGGNVVENNENAYLGSTKNDKGGKEEVKRERKRAKNDDESDRKALDNGDDKLTEEVVDNPRRATRSRGLKVMEDAMKKEEKGGNVVENNENAYLTENDRGGRDEVKRERRRAKNDDESDRKALDNSDDDKLIEKVVDNPRRVTRSRGQKVMEDATKKEEKGGNVVKNNENAYLSSTENDKEGKEEVKRERKRAKNDDESDRKALDNGDDDKLTEKVVDNPRRATRSRGLKEMKDATKKDDKGGNVVENNENAYLSSTENDNGKGLVSRIAKRVGSKGKVGEELLKNQPIAEVDGMIEPPRIRRSRRKADKLGNPEIVNDGAMKTENGGFKGAKETPKLLAADGSGMDVANAGDKINEDRSLVVQVEEPIQLNRRSNRRKTEVENAELKMENPAVQSNTRRSTRNASKNKSSETVDELGGNGIIQPKNDARKRKKGTVSEDVTANNVQNKQLAWIEHERKKAAPSTAVAVEVADEKKPPSFLEQTHESDIALSQERCQGTEHSSFVDVQLLVPEVEESAEDLGLASSTSGKNISNGVQFASRGKSLSKKKEVIVTDGVRSAEPGVEVINRDEAEMILSRLDSDVLESTEVLVPETDNNDPEPQVVGQAEDISCNIKTDNEVVPEGSNVPENVSSAEKSLADSIVPSDQADFKTDFEETQHKDKLPEHRLAVLDDVHEVHGVFIPENLESEGNVNVGSCQQNDVDNSESYSNSQKINNSDTFLKAGETLVFESSDEQNGSVNSKGAHQLKESSASKLRIIQEDDNTTEENGTHEVGFLNDCEGASVEDNVFCVSDLFDAEYSITDFEEKEMRDDSMAEAPITISANCTEVNIDRHSEYDNIGKSCEGESAVDHTGKSDEGKSVEDHIGKKDDGKSVLDDKSDSSDEDGECMSNLFDSERRASITSQDGGAFSARYLITGSNKHDISTLQEIIPSKSEDVLEFLEVGASVGDMAQGQTNAISQSNILGEELFTAKTINVGEFEVEIQADEHCKDDTYESVEHLNIPLVNPVPDPVQEHEACSVVENGPEMSISRTNGGKGRLDPVQVPNTDYDAGDANLNMVMENTADACATDVTISVSPSTRGYEKMKETECKDLVTNHAPLSAGDETSNTEYSQSSTGISLNNLSGKSEDDVTFKALNHTPLGTEIAKTLSVKRSVVSSRDSLTRKDDKEMEREQESETVETTSSGCCNVGMEADQLKLLFATPCTANDTSANDRNLDGTPVSLKEDPETMIEKLVTQMKFEEMGGTTLEYNIEDVTYAESNGAESAKVPSKVESKIGASEGHLTKNACESGEVKEFKEVENVELVNTCTAEIPSEVEYEICEASNAQSSENLYKCEEENDYTAKGSSEAEYLIYEVSGEQLTENTCTRKTPEANEHNAHEVSEGQLTENTCDHREEIIITPEGPSEVKYNVHYVPSKVESGIGASEGHLTKNAWESGEVEELKEVDNVEMVNTCTAEIPSEVEYEVCETSSAQSSENLYKCEEENDYTAKVSSEPEYLIYEVSGEQLTENTCTTKTPEANEHNAHEVSEEQLAENTCDRREEISITPEGPSEVEYNAHYVSAQQLAEITSDCREEVFFTTDGPSEVEHSPSKVSQEASKEQLTENGIVELVNTCTAQVPSIEGPEEQLFKKTSEFKEETKWNERLNEELVDAHIAKVTPGATSFVCQASEEQFTENACESQEGTRLNETEDANVLNNEAFGEPVAEDTCEGEHETHFLVNNLEEKHLDETKLSPDMLMETECSENLSCGNTCSAVSTGGLMQRNEVELELPDADGDISREASMDDYCGPLDADKDTLSRTLPRGSASNKKVMDTIAKLSKEEGGSPVSAVQSDDILSNSAMRLLLGGDENGNLYKPKQEMDFFNTKADQDTDVEDIKESSTPTIEQFNIPTLQTEAGSEELNKNIPSITNAPVSECNSVLKESDVADTIKEYIDTESSPAANLDDSDRPTLPNNIVTAPKSPAHIVKPLEEGSAVNPKRRIFSTVKRNARTILIHGTSRKAVRCVEIKENAPSQKGSSIGDLTAVRPKREAPQDVRWKY